MIVLLIDDGEKIGMKNIGKYSSFYGKRRKLGCLLKFTPSMILTTTPSQ